MYVTYTTCDHCGEKMTEGMHLFLGPDVFYDFCPKCAEVVERYLTLYTSLVKTEGA